MRSIIWPRASRALSKFAFFAQAETKTTARRILQKTAELESEQGGGPISGPVISGNSDMAALARLSRKTPATMPQLRTTCVATHAARRATRFNALPQCRARATVNCRIMPGEPVDEVKAEHWNACLLIRRFQCARMHQPLPQPTIAA